MTPIACFLKKSTLALLILSCLLPNLLISQTIWINSTNDNGNGTLREAIAISNPGDTLRFTNQINGQPIVLTSGELNIIHDLVIIGNDTTNTLISGSNVQRIFNAFNCNLSLADLTLYNGFSESGGGAIVTTNVNLILESCLLYQNNADIQGGGLLHYDGTVTINNSIIRDNTVNGSFDDFGGGGIANFGAMVSITNSTLSNNEVLNQGIGGALLNAGIGSLNIDNCSILNNSAHQSGGGIADISDTASTTSILSTSVSGNSTTAVNSAGGGMVIGPGSVSLSDCTFSDNTADLIGGAIWIGTGTLDISNSVINNNTSSQSGGAIFNMAGTLSILNSSSIDQNTTTLPNSMGGGIYNDIEGKLTITNTTISDNTSGQAGGGLADFSSNSFVTMLDQVTAENNQATGETSVAGGILINDGLMQLNNSSISFNSSSLQGGAIWLGSGTLYIDNSAINNNTSGQSGGAIFNMAGSLSIYNSSSIDNNTAMASNSLGGGIYNDIAGKLTINNTSISNNSSGQAGGGLADLSDISFVSSLDQVVLENNQVVGETSVAGGILFNDGLMLLKNSTLNANSSSLQGGGIWVGSGTLDIDNSIISSNTTGQSGGAIFNMAGALSIFNSSSMDQNTATLPNSIGGGIYNDEAGKLTISNTSFNGNSCGQAGGAIADVSDSTFTSEFDQLTIQNNKALSENSAAGGLLIGDGKVLLTNSILSSNSSSVQGGGIWIGNGSLEIGTTDINLNTTGSSGGGIYNQAGQIDILNNTSISENSCTATDSQGGGIYNNINGKLSISNSSITNNACLQAGGGLADVSDNTFTTVVDQSIIESNIASGEKSAGGGILLAEGSMKLLNSSVTFNSSEIQGGGIWTQNSSLEIDNSSISNNTSGIGGGGIFTTGGTIDIINNSHLNENVLIDSGSLGGGIFNDSTGMLSITQSTLEQNVCKQAGAAIADISDTSFTSQLSGVRLINNQSNGMNSVAGGLLLANGKMHISNSNLSGNSSILEGGGIWVENASIIIDSCSLDSNATGMRGGGIYIGSGALRIIAGSSVKNNSCQPEQSVGGGIFKNQAASLFMKDSEISHNTSSSGGGIIAITRDQTADSILHCMIAYNKATDTFSIGGGMLLYGAGIMNIQNSSISGNEANFRGGGIWSTLDSLVILSISIDSNTIEGTSDGVGGGGIYHAEGLLSIETSTLYENKVTGSTSAGGGILNSTNAALEINRSTLSNNHAQNAGGGLYNSGNASIIACTFSQNKSMGTGGAIQQASSAGMNTPSTELRSSLITNNSAQNVGQDIYAENAPFISAGYNLISIEEDNFFLESPSDIIGSLSNPIMAMLGPLEDNGGNTLTHALECPSQAINSGDPALNGPDQRGRQIFGPQRDIGAFEYQDTCASTSISGDIPFDDIKVYPNPVMGHLVKIEVGGELNRLINIEVISSSSGRIHLIKTFESTVITLDVSGLAPGHYMLKISKEGKVAYRKLIIL